LKFVDGITNTRAAGVPSAGHAAGSLASLIRRETSNSRPHDGHENA